MQMVECRLVEVEKISFISKSEDELEERKEF